MLHESKSFRYHITAMNPFLSHSYLVCAEQKKLSPVESDIRTESVFLISTSFM